MTEARLTNININEALIYMGYKGGGIPDDIMETVLACAADLKAAAKPRAIWRKFSLGDDRTFIGSGFKPRGENVGQLLAECDEAILMAATLGVEADRLISRSQITDMTKALILDACASSAIENVCDNLCADLEKEFEGMYFTDRFSPGYGDLPLEQQKSLCAVLETAKRIGLAVTDSGLLTPLKSVTAIVGISTKPQTKRFRGCAYCSMFKNCSFRKESRYCGR